MKFSAVFVAAAALLCASVNATMDLGQVKGQALVFESPSLRQESLVKGQALVHSRSEALATSNIAVPDATNPYVKSKDVSVVGVAFSATKESDSTASNASSSSAYTIPLAVGGCAVAAVGIAGFVFMKKRKQQTKDEEDDEAKTPASGSPSNQVVDYKDDMQTPVPV